MSAHLPTMPPRPSGDITITATHREVMRRLDRGESLTLELAESLGALYLHELVDDVAVEGHPFRMPALTSLGRRVLDVGGVLTARQERPRLVSRPMPAEWRDMGLVPSRDGGGLVSQFGHSRSGIGLYALHVDMAAEAFEVFSGGEWLSLDNALADARAMLSVLEWLTHERAVRAQDGGS